MYLLFRVERLCFEISCFLYYFFSCSRSCKILFAKLGKSFNISDIASIRHSDLGVKISFNRIFSDTLTAVRYWFKVPHVLSTIVWPQTLSLFFFSFFFLIFFFFFFFFFLKGHNTCIAYRIFVYFSPLARKKGFCSALGNLMLELVYKYMYKSQPLSVKLRSMSQTLKLLITHDDTM